MNSKSGLFFAIIATASTALYGQSKWFIAANAGAVISKTATSDTLANPFTTRNRGNIYGYLQGTYDLSKASSLNFKVGYLGTGFRINNDTMPNNGMIKQPVDMLSTSLGISFRQRFSTGSFITENFGIALNQQLGGSLTDTIYNQTKNARYRIVHDNIVKTFPAFYLGFGMGGNTDEGHRYEFTVSYQQPFSTARQMRVEYGEFYNQSFPLTFRGGNLQVGFTFYFNFGALEKSQDYFY
jgi:hypothetical protein